MVRHLLIVVLLLWPVAGWATHVAPAHDATTTDIDNNAQQNPTASHTRGGTCPDPVAIISVGWQHATPPTISSVTYGGSAATSLGASVGTGSGDIKGQSFIYKNPSSGAATVQVNYSSTPNDSTILVRTFCNVDQTTSTGTVATATGSSTTASVNVSSATGELVVDAVISGLNAGSTGSATVGASQTQRANFSVSGNHRHLGSDEPGAGTTTMDWTYNATREWAAIGIPLKPAADAGGQPTMRRWGGIPGMGPNLTGRGGF